MIAFIVVSRGIDQRPRVLFFAGMLVEVLPQHTGEYSHLNNELCGSIAGLEE